MKAELKDLLEKPVWQMTGEELLRLTQQTKKESMSVLPEEPVQKIGKRYVYGISGIAQLFGCSIPTANRIKKSGKIDRAITQIGRTIVTDAELALDLANRKPHKKQ